MYNGLTPDDAAMEAIGIAMMNVARMSAERERLEAERDAAVAETAEALSELAEARDGLKRWMLECERLQRIAAKRGELDNAELSAMQRERREGGS